MVDEAASAATEAAADTATPRISLALVLHNHQPVGNFGWVIAESFERAYRPMVGALERHPGVRMGLHYSGPLLGWLEHERPDFLDRVRALIARRQVEILGGGWYEPVLVALPERDRIGQLTRMADELDRLFASRPGGAWLAERVWEPDLPTSLVAAGYGWTVLDDAHFRAAAIPEDALWGPYTTDDQGFMVRVFGTEQGLRYRIPFADVEDVIDHLREHATRSGDLIGTMGDDGEKFGSWPTTYKHCWEEGWVERFFTALEANGDWLATTTPSDWLADHPPVGRVSIPTGSYTEMGEWAMPADEALAFAGAVREAREHGRPEARWLRGAAWRNFQVKYREVNDLHKQMLRVSELVESMAAGNPRERARDHLYAGQSNDPYWHGLFGGTYLPDLRVSALSNLIAAEDAARIAGVPAARASGVRVDLDLDARDEVLLSTDGLIVAVKPDEGAGIGRWDVVATRFPLAAVMRRRPEAYHEKVRAAAAMEAGAGGAGGAATSIHEMVAAKAEGLAEHLRYDAYERRSGLLRFFDRETTAADVAADRAIERGDFVTGDWEVVELDEGSVVLARSGVVDAADGPRLVDAESRIRVAGGRLDPVLSVQMTVINADDRPLDVLAGVEWNVMLLGGGGNPAAWHDLGEGTIRHDATATATGVTRLAAGNDDVGVIVTTTIEPAVDAWIRPIETVSNSEGGFELVYQGSSTLLVRRLRLEPGERADLSIEQRVTSR
jgi:4-alpha-glucanotransferase